MRSIQCGTPVIASQYKSLVFTKDYGLGRLVDHPLKYRPPFTNQRIANMSIAKAVLFFLAAACFSSKLICALQNPAPLHKFFNLSIAI